MNVITGRGSEVGDALVTHDMIRRVAFTGATAGRPPHHGPAAPKLKRMTMELGGSDPMIVCPDANIKAAVKGIAIGRFWNAARSCLGGKRIYVFDEVYDELIGAAHRTGRQVRARRRAGRRPRSRSIRVGPLHTSAGRDELAGAARRTRSTAAASCCSAAATPRAQGLLLRSRRSSPTPPHDSRRRARGDRSGRCCRSGASSDLDEAIGLANDTRVRPRRVGLDQRRPATSTARRNEVDAGMKWVNQFHYGYDELPFGGVKQSGLRQGARHGGVPRPLPRGHVASSSEG